VSEVRYVKLTPEELPDMPELYKLVEEPLRKIDVSC
jgi:hypothetical protein